MHHLVVDAHVATDRVEGDIAGLQDGAKRTARPAQQGLGTGDQLAHGERLDEVIVGAGVEAGDAVLHGIARRQHEDGHRLATGPHLLQQFQPIAVGQAEIENGGVIGPDLQRSARIGAKSDCVHREAGTRQRRAEDLHDAHFVLNDQEPHVRHLVICVATCWLRWAPSYPTATYEVYGSFKPAQLGCAGQPVPG